MTSPKFRSLKSGLIGSAALFVLALPAYAQPSLENTKDLGQVLNQFATDANVEILFSPDLVNERVTNAAELSGEPRENLSKILSGTGLSFEEPSPDVFIITEAAVPTMPASSKEQARSEAVRTNVQQTAQVQTQEPSNADVTPTAMPNRIDLEAAPGVISGQVTDRFSGQALAGAIVRLEGSERTASTDVRGFYRFSAAPVGEYGISVNYLGAEFQSRRVAVVSGQAVTQNFSLGNQLDELVVYGNRSSLQQALNQQRAADNSATVVSSDLLGSFPAENISEALRRVSGVTFSRNAASGEGDRITVRGFNDQAINIQLNGVDLQGTGIDRGIDLSGFLTDNIKQVTIQKSLLPSQEATGSGGLVEIETRSGLDYGERYFSAAAEFESPFASGFGDEFEISGTGAYRFNDDFGVTATVQYRETDGQNYDVSILQVLPSVLPEGFTSSLSVPESFDFPFDPEFSEPLIRGANYFSRQRDVANLTASLGFAYDWDDHSRFRLDLQNIQSDSTFATARSTMSAASLSVNAIAVPELNDEIRDRTFIRGLQPALGADNSEENFRTTNISFRGETDIDNWEFDYTAGFSQSERERKLDSVSITSARNDDLDGLFDVDPALIITNGATQRLLTTNATTFTSNGIPLLNLTAAGNEFISSGDTYEATIATRSDAVDTTDNYTLEFDARRYFNNSPLDYLEIGVKYDDRTRSNSDDVLSTTNLTSSQSFVRRFGQALSLSELGISNLGVLDLSDVGITNSNVPVLTFDSAGSIIDTIANFVEDDPNTPENEARYTFTDRTLQNPIDDSGAIAPAEIKEQIFASYIEGKAEFGDFDIVGGVRYQREARQGRLISAPSIRTDTGLEPRSTFVDAGLVDFLGTDLVQETWTPSVIANYRPTEELVVRGAYFRSTIHPTIDKIARPTLIVLDLRAGRETGVIREANPDLDPSSTDNFDLDFSYYFKDNPGLVRLGLFYKTISNNFTQILQPAVPGGDDVRQRILDELAVLGNIDPTLIALPADGEYSIQRPVNGEGGDIYGFELELIRQLDFFPETWPSFVENFSVLGNLTYTKSEFQENETARNDAGEQFTLSLDTPLTGQSEWAGNASVRYEDGPFSGSVIYTYQSASATSFDEFNINGITPEFDTLDLRVSYTLKAKGNRPLMVFFAEGDDLLRSAEEADLRSAISSQFGTGSADFFFPTQYQFNGGRRFTVGARMTF